MFALTPEELATCRFLGAADGPAGFNAELTARGGRVISTDPIYRFTRLELRQRIDETTETVIRKVRERRDGFHWEDGDYPSPEALREARLSAMSLFLNDYETGLEEGRYVDAELPCLPFEDNAFDIALCSHYLFLYSEIIDFEAHLAAITELLRLAPQVRIYPVVNIDSSLSRWLEPVLEKLKRADYQTELIPVPTRVLRNSYKTLKITRSPTSG